MDNYKRFLKIAQCGIFDENTIKEMEVIVNELSNTPSCLELYNSEMLKDSNVLFYTVGILRLRINRKKYNLESLREEVEVVNRMIQENISYQLIDVFVDLGLYCWPMLMNNFFDVMLIKLKENPEVGYRIFLTFLEKLNYSESLSKPRKAELKTSVRYVVGSFMSQMDERYAQYIIPTMKELLKIMPKELDFTFVYNNAHLFPDKAISLFDEGWDFIDINKLFEILPKIPSSPLLTCNFVECAKYTSQHLFQYMFSCIKNEECFFDCCVFWKKVFVLNTNLEVSNYVKPILSEIILMYNQLGQTDEEESAILALISSTLKVYPEQVASLCKESSSSINLRFSLFILNNLNKYKPELLKHLKGFNNPLLDGTVCFYLKDLATPEFIPLLNYNEKEAIKLLINILYTYQFTPIQYKEIYKLTEQFTGTEELHSLIDFKLGNLISFDCVWTKKIAIKYFYYLKKDREYYSNYKEMFYRFFINNIPFDRCFLVLKLLGNIPDEILNVIYIKFDTFPLMYIGCFNNELLPYLDSSNINVFIKKEIDYFIRTWDTVIDFNEYNKSLKILINQMNNLSAKINNFQNNLTVLMQIDHPSVVFRLLNMFNSGSDDFDTLQGVFNLITIYNSPNLYLSQSLAVNGLVKCLCKDDGPEAFVRILGLDINTCLEVKKNLIKIPKKAGSSLIKDLVKNYKATPYNKMYSNNVKIAKQGLFNKEKNNSVDSVDISEFTK
ncbi:hypothetical protein A0H76_672 [Hepatospora eriocheir]|uniref:Uncharacterized protein n=1 Tax=Hepatospora eriocheir TaxID=1081669 RepID=A0A1X0QL21_9MICR|nr:hypothetical protein A0H76_672 [Hepatospora eriocheir]